MRRKREPLSETVSPPEEKPTPLYDDVIPQQQEFLTRSVLDTKVLIKSHARLHGVATPSHYVLRAHAKHLVAQLRIRDYS